MDTLTANELIAGAPGIVRLGDTEYLAAPATDKTFIAARNYIKSKLKTPLEAVAAVVQNLPPAIRAEALKAAVAQQSGGAEITAEAATEVMMSLDGCRFLAWLHMRPPANPELTREKLESLITEDNYLDVFSMLDEATGVTKLAARKGGGQEGNPPGRPG